MPALRKIRSKYYAYFYDPSRRPKRKSVPLRTGLKTAAEKKLRRLEILYAEGRFDPWRNNTSYRQDLSIDAAFEAFVSDRSHLRPKSIAAYASVFAGLRSVCSKKRSIRDVTAEDINHYVTDANVAQSTRRHRAQHLKAFFRWAKQTGLVIDNPLDQVRMPKRKQKVPEFLSPTELEQLLLTIDADATEKESQHLVSSGEILWLKDLVLVAVNTGLRRGELINLNWADIDFESGFLTVRNRDSFETKSGHERRVPLSREAQHIFRRLRTDSASVNDPVFTGTGGGRLNAEYASKRFKHYVRAAGLPSNIRFHSLRHTTASWLVQRGVSLPVVQAILGHSDIQVTQRYAHLSPEILKLAVENTFGK